MRLQSSSSISSSSQLSLALLLAPLLASASPLATTTIDPPSQDTPTASPSPALDPSTWLPTSTILPTRALDLREIAPVGAVGVAAPLNPTQVSPVTTLMEWQTIAPGAPAQQVQVVYSQIFEAVPDPWEEPKQGSIGMGTIKGSVGVVKTADGAKVKVRRNASPTAAPDAESEAEAFVILPPGNDDAPRGRLEKRKGKSGSSSSGSGEEEEEEEGAAATLGISAAASTLALLIAVVAVMGL